MAPIAASTPIHPRRRVIAVPSDVSVTHVDPEISLDVFRSLLLEMTGRDVPPLSDSVVQSDPVAAGTRRR